MNTLASLVSIVSLFLSVFLVPTVPVNSPADDLDFSLFHFHRLEDYRLGYRLSDSTTAECNFTNESFFDAAPSPKADYRICKLVGVLGTYLMTVNSEYRPFKIELRFETEQDVDALISEMYEMKRSDLTGYHRSKQGSTEYVYRSDHAGVHFLAMYIETY